MFSILALISFLPAIVYSVQIVFYLLSIYKSSMKKNHEVLNMKDPPGVTVIKPLMGTDILLEENLISHFQINYPKVSFYYTNDPVIPMVQRVRNQFSSVESKLIIGESGYNITNPMVENMVKAYETAKYNLIWVSTSRIRANSRILEDLVKKSLDPTVAIVHQMPYFTDQISFAHAVDKISAGCYLSRIYIALNTINICCFTGMSYIIKKNLLEDIGGLVSYGKYLAEDFFISKVLHSKGYRIKLSFYPAQQNVGDSSLLIYKNRMVRWLRLRITMIPHIALFIEPLNETLTLGLMTAFSVNYHFDLSIKNTFLCHIVIWMILDRILLHFVQKGPISFNFITYIFAWVVKEIMVYVIFIEALTNIHFVTWGPNSYHIRWGGVTSLHYRETLQIDMKY